MSLDQTAHAVEPNEEHAANGKSPSFHLLPNSETFHRVKDPLVINHDKDHDHDHADHVDGEHVHDGDEKSASFHRLPNSETFHVVKDPLKVK